MPIRRFGRPGLLGLAARTAVVAGTAGAVSGAMRNGGRRRAQQEYEHEQYEQAQQQAAMAANATQQTISPAVPSAPSASAAGGDVVIELQRLADLKASGALTDTEFAAAKQKLLG